MSDYDFIWGIVTNYIKHHNIQNIFLDSIVNRNNRTEIHFSYMSARSIVTRREKFALPEFIETETIEKVFKDAGKMNVR